VRQPVQIELFPAEEGEAGEQRQQQLAAGLDRIRRKSGKSLVKPGLLFDAPPRAARRRD
jgi:hypothetical protein